MFEVIKIAFLVVWRDVRVQAAIGTLITTVLATLATWATTPEGGKTLGAAAILFGLLTPLVQGVKKFFGLGDEVPKVEAKK